MKKRIYLIGISVAFILIYFQIKNLAYQKSLTACIAQLEKLAKESKLNHTSDIEPFQLFPVNEKNGYRSTVFGYKDKKGKIVLPATFTQAWPFSEGKAAIADRNWYWGFINPNGQIVIPYQFQRVSSFYGGVAAFSGIKGDKDKDGFIDKNGKILITLEDNGGYFADDFYGFKNGYIESSRLTWDPLELHGNPHPRVNISVDCTGKITEMK
jgi:WG containing repeat